MRTPVLLLLSLCSLACHAQVYKWTDANGQVHYSERKPDAAGAQPKPVAIVKSPEAPAVPAKAAPVQQPFPGQFAPPGAGPQAQAEPAAQRAPRALSEGRENGSDASRCQLARDVLNGSLRYANGNPMDQHGREVAQNDVKAFCR